VLKTFGTIHTHITTCVALWNDEKKKGKINYTVYW